MIVVYDKYTGEIAYTVEGAMVYDGNKLSTNDAMIVTKDETIRSNTHKVVNGRVERKAPTQIDAEMHQRHEQERLALESIHASRANLLDRLEDMERRLAKLEETGST